MDFCAACKALSLWELVGYIFLITAIYFIRKRQVRRESESESPYD